MPRIARMVLRACTPLEQPALRQVTQAASGIACLGNLRRIGIGLHGCAYRVAAPTELEVTRHPGNGHAPYWWVGSGDQYGGLVTIPITQRVSGLFADGHVQMLDKAQVWTCLTWAVPGGDL